MAEKFHMFFENFQPKEPAGLQCPPRLYLLVTELKEDEDPDLADVDALITLLDVLDGETPVTGGGLAHREPLVLIA